AFAELFEHALQVFDHGVAAVDAVRRPVAVAVAARVESDGEVAGLAQRFPGALPGVAGLAAAVLQYHQGTVLVAPEVAGQLDAVALPIPHGLGRARQP